MQRSESISALAAALSKAQGSMGGAKKDAANPFFKTKYADLASVWDACREPLAKNGLAVIQFARGSEHGVAVETMLSHSSGEWVSEILELPVNKRDAQGVGSAVTYARRYSLAAMVGVAPEDDDGNAASKPPWKEVTLPEKPVELDQVLKAKYDAALVAAGSVEALNAAYLATPVEYRTPELIEVAKRCKAAILSAQQQSQDVDQVVKEWREKLVKATLIQRNEWWKHVQTLDEPVRTAVCSMFGLDASNQGLGFDEAADQFIELPELP